MGLDKLHIEDEERKVVLYSGSNGASQPVISFEKTDIGRYVATFKADARGSGVPMANYQNLMMFLLAAHRTHDISSEIRGGYCDDPLNARAYPAVFDTQRAYDPAHADELFRKCAALSFSMETDMFPFIGLRSSVADETGYLPGVWSNHTHFVTLETEKNVSYDLSNLLTGMNLRGLTPALKQDLYPLLEDITSRVLPERHDYKEIRTA
ncbi:MAG: hypothetical protein KKE20_07140 [Nanoarchaeota archaeon]|nr:hypothetical protein [Nanoarchaeota archaeon]